MSEKLIESLEDYGWVDDLQSHPIIRDDSDDHIIEGAAIHVTISGNDVKYVDEELLRSARTLVGKRILHNHEETEEEIINAHGSLIHPVNCGIDKDAEYDEVRKFIHYIAQITDPWLWSVRDRWTGVSIGAVPRATKEANGIETPQGIIFEDLSVVTEPEQPGDPRASIKILKENLKLAKSLKLIEKLQTQMVRKPDEPNEEEMHDDFKPIWKGMQDQYGKGSKKAQTVYYAWLNKNGLDDSKPFPKNFKPKEVAITETQVVNAVFVDKNTDHIDLKESHIILVTEKEGSSEVQREASPTASPLQNGGQVTSHKGSRTSETDFKNSSKGETENMLAKEDIETIRELVHKELEGFAKGNTPLYTDPSQKAPVQPKVFTGPSKSTATEQDEIEAMKARMDELEARIATVGSSGSAVTNPQTGLPGGKADVVSDETEQDEQDEQDEEEKLRKKKEAVRFGVKAAPGAENKITGDANEKPETIRDIIFSTLRFRK